MSPRGGALPLTFGAACGIAGLALLAGGHRPAAPAAAARTAPPVTAAVAPAAEPARGEIVAPAPKDPAKEPSRQLLLPDGTSVPTLNGAVDAAPLAKFWGPRPYSPIVGVERSSAGIDWYRHENGSYSTTQMVWRADLGRYDAMTRVAHEGPLPAAPAGEGR